MNFEIIIKEEAYRDLQIAYDYYEEQMPGLGDELLEEIKVKLAYIKKYPLHFAKVHKAFRQSLIARFSYLLIYEISGNKILVYSLFHTSQNPLNKFK